MRVAGWSLTDELTSKKERYDTREIVYRFKREERSSRFIVVAVLLAIAGAVVYGITHADQLKPHHQDGGATAGAKPAGSEASPEAKPEASPEAKDGRPETKDEAKADPKSEPAKQSEPEPPAAAKVRVLLPPKAALSVNGKVQSSKRRTIELQLTPGIHTLRAKVGKRTLTQKLKLTPGSAYVVTFETKKVTVKEDGK